MTPEGVLREAGLGMDGRPERLSGGDMGEVWRCGSVVVKSHPSPPAGLFVGEAAGLRRLAAAGVVVPTVHYASESGLVMDWLGAGARDPEQLAAVIAGLHRTRGGPYGSAEGVFLGRFRLAAGQSTDWRTVFVEHRLRPLLNATRATLGDGADVVERVIDEVQPAAEGPVLVHGDLWAGNVVDGAAGPALIDPSVQVAERAVDLAMMQLFGGFSPRFWAAYEAELPIPGPVRRTIGYHQLLYLLVHVHFFGRSYVRQTVDVARAALGAI